MIKLKFSLCAVGAYLILAAACVLFGSRPATGQKGSPPGPDVRVVNTASEPVPVIVKGAAQISGEVKVVNTPTVKLDTRTPIPVTVVTPALQPFQATIGTAGDSFTVPEGKLLVIEHVSGFQISIHTLFYYTLRTTAGGQIADHTFPVSLSGNNGIQNRYAFAQDAHLYADPGTDVSFFANGSGEALIDSIKISGHLVDVP